LQKFLKASKENSKTFQGLWSFSSTFKALKSPLLNSMTIKNKWQPVKKSFLKADLNCNLLVFLFSFTNHKHSINCGLLCSGLDTASTHK